jgi:hypothetical protein
LLGCKTLPGDITYYEAVLGACGMTSNGTVKKVVALPLVLMGPLSNNNPNCGKTTTIKCSATGKSMTATIVDKCMRYEDYAIDLCIAAFLDLMISLSVVSWVRGGSIICCNGSRTLNRR